MNPPVPITAPFEKYNIPTSRASAVDSMTSSSETSYFCISSGSTWTCGILMRSPQMGYIGDPGDTQQAGPDGPVGDHRHVDQGDAF